MTQARAVGLNPVGRPRPLVVGVLSALFSVSLPALAQELTVTPSFGDTGSVDPQDGVTLVLSRPLNESEGQLAVLVGTTDWTNLFESSEKLLTFRPDPVPLPMGETEISVHLVYLSWDERQTEGVRPPPGSRRAGSVAAKEARWRPTATTRVGPLTTCATTS